MTDNIKTAVTLFIITLISGLVLGCVYGITKGPIEEANKAATYAAYAELLPGASDYNDKPEVVEAANAGLAGKSYGNVTVDNVVEAVDGSGSAMGYVVTATSNDGFGGAIQLTVGYKDEGGELKSTGISFLSIAETAGLGMNATIEGEGSFKSQFEGKSAVELTLVKSGNAGDAEIDAMSGASITSGAVTNAVNAANFAVADCLG